MSQDTVPSQDLCMLEVRPFKPRQTQVAKVSFENRALQACAFEVEGQNGMDATRVRLDMKAGVLNSRHHVESSNVDFLNTISNADILRLRLHDN